MTDGVGASRQRWALAKFIVALVGLAVFGAGVRTDSAAVRWVGIGCIAVAWLMRLVRRAADSVDQLPDETR